MTRARDNADLGDSFGVLGSGVTGGTGLTAIAGVTTGSGNVTIANGNLVIGTSGKGIDFSATSDAGGMTSELLDDYEEGTWTAVLQFGGASVGIVYISDGQTGTYTKIGNIVIAKGFIGISNNGSSTGSADITGLPFTSSSATRTNSVVSFWPENISFADFPTGILSTDRTYINLQQISNAGSVSALTNSNFPDASYMNFTVIYLT